MARIIYSGLVTKISGSIGGTTFQANAYGFTCKNKPNMIKPNSSFQQQRKLAFGRAVKLWSGLTTPQRNDWNTWASTNPQFAKNNPGSVLSGFAVFVRTMVLNQIASDLSIPAIVSPTATIEPLDIVTWTLTNLAGVLTLNSTFGTGGATLLSLVSVSRPFNGAQNFAGSAPRFMVGLANDDDNTLLTAKYIAQFGKVPAIGETVIIRIKLFNPTNGQVFAASDQRVTVT